MRYHEMSPQELLVAGNHAPEINDVPWLVRWDEVRDPEATVARLLPETVEFHTSGTTGPEEAWVRTAEQLWDEAGLLAGLIAPRRPDAVLACAPARHLFGALATVLLPARLRVPAWYRPQYYGAMPQAGRRRWAVVGVPWTFSVLLRHSEWVRAAEQVTVLHSTAMLPTAAARLVQTEGADQVSVTEVFGSTETGGVASRVWGPDDPLWELLPDVRPAWGEPDATGEVLLAVSSPRLAHRPGLPHPASHRTDDYIRAGADHRFRFSGRRGRLVKVNGRRVNLDELERLLRDVVHCADLACLPVTDPVSGENLDLLVVPAPGEELVGGDVRAVLATAGLVVRPRRVHVVDRIDRSDTGKLRRVQPPLPTRAGARSDR
ncbi:hypothetical protein J7F02_02560 [Streptomyces sp. ISL-112]|uniref:hypothetical protein n=2 Tax=Streptomyces TaxID=1883 RepID=UPI001BEA16D7|nr:MULTISPECIES: hypothetical protein [unclassified Streptomyces]MBT2424620.1 hypothetical protein [Streptomyces sp. ISL-112]MBT2465155.1 hypothetical protein [Streptomyces sp. ISL-63]